jgi:hypothetical protein
MSNDIPQHKSLAMGKSPATSGPPTREKYREGGSVHGSHGHGKGVPKMPSHGKKMPGK